MRSVERTSLSVPIPIPVLSLTFSIPFMVATVSVQRNPVAFSIALRKRTHRDHPLAIAVHGSTNHRRIPRMRSIPLHPISLSIHLPFSIPIRQYAGTTHYSLPLPIPIPFSLLPFPLTSAFRIHTRSPRTRPRLKVPTRCANPSKTHPAHAHRTHTQRATHRYSHRHSNPKPDPKPRTARIIRPGPRRDSTRTWGAKVGR
jgi:hypothetical protein